MVRSLIRLMRPGDWVKNVFVLPALVFALPSLLAAPMGAGDSTDLSALIRSTLMAVAAFCFVSSGFYAVNDVLDVEADRVHPVKRERPVASGAVPVRVALVFGLALIAIGLGVGAVVSAGLLVVLCLYTALQVLYNVRLKRVMFVDVVVVASGFALRAAAGAVAIEVQISIWLILCVFFLCLYLAFIKRLCDIASAERGGARLWRSPAGYDDRGELNWLLGISGVLAVMAYLMYALSDHAHSLFGSKSTGFAVLTPLVLIAVHRFYRRANAGVSDSPLAALREDRAVMASVALFAIGTLATLYIPAVGVVLDHLFFVTEADVSK